MMSIAPEVVQAVRRLLRRPVSAAGIVLTLTLGIAISVSMFSVLHGVVLQALPYPDGDRIVNIFSENLEQNSRRGFTAAEALEGLTEIPGFEYTAYYNTPPFLVHGGDGPSQMQIANVSQDYFSVFGVPAALGRTLNDGDFGEGRPVVVLSHVAWIELTGGDPEAIGRVLTIQTLDSSETSQLEVVGVLDDWFEHPHAEALLYRPWDTTAPISSSSLRIVSAVGKLVPGASEVAAQGLRTRMAAVQEAHGSLERDWQARHAALIDDLVGDVRGLLLALFSVSVLVLLIACSTTSSLVSIRLEQRHREFSIRRALGASRTRVAMDVAFEGAMLAALGGFSGMLLAYVVVEAMQPLALGILPRAQDIEIDGAALGYATAATVASALLSGVAPMLRALGTHSAERLHSGTRREVTSNRKIALSPIAGVGLAATALVTALALSLSLVRLGAVELGFRIEQVAAIELMRSQPAEQMMTFLDRAIEELHALPGVQDVAAIVGSPPTREFSGWTPMEFTVPGDGPSEPVLARVRTASPGYHRLLEIPLLSGRDISEQDSMSAPRVVVINETLARQAFGFGNTDAVGQVLMVGMGGQPVPLEVVGVIADSRNAGLRAPVQPEMTFPLRQWPLPTVTLLVSSAVLPSNWVRPLQEAIRRADPNQAIARSYLLADDLNSQIRRDRLFAITTAWFAVLALVLGAFGINAVIAAMQRRRTREIGLRMALGASSYQAAAMVLGNATRIAGLGLAVGMLLAVPTVSGLQHLLFGVEAGTFWGLFGLTALMLMIVALAAAGWPAWRASRTAPMEALRHE